MAIGRGLLPVAFAVAGHHCGLPDGGSALDSAGEPTLVGRSGKQVPACDNWKEEIHLPQTAIPAWAFSEADPFTQSFFTRMLFSCLVDADFLDTESFMQGKERKKEHETIPDLLGKLRKVTDGWLKAPASSPLNACRNEILQSCIDKGRNGERGLYTLSVPTGGGKTISSLAFALEHAVKNHMDRVIYVIPYTSIIDQTAEVMQKILGSENVLAHYAEADYYMAEREDLSAEDYRKLLASENWDMPVMITTAVQFFDSLFANRSAKCRKLHNIANSVIIFDEAQTLPVSSFRPCVGVIAQLVMHYRTNVVLCTATQPCLGPLFKEYGLQAMEICSHAPQYYKKLRRTVIKDLGEIDQEELLSRLSDQPQVLCVVNRRKTAQDMFRALPPEGAYCLTTLLMPTDRRKQLDEIRIRLQKGLVCRVVSTSLIEAGVDVDFPAAYREEAGLDSLLQTAGRCNREGREADPGKCPVYMFRFTEVRPPSMIVQNVAAISAAWGMYAEADLPETIEYYFSVLLYRIKKRPNCEKYPAGP